VKKVVDILENQYKYSYNNTNQRVLKQMFPTTKNIHSMLGERFIKRCEYTYAPSGGIE
jgi:hypothetical protein